MRVCRAFQYARLIVFAWLWFCCIFQLSSRCYLVGEGCDVRNPLMCAEIPQLCPEASLTSTDQTSTFQSLAVGSFPPPSLKQVSTGFASGEDDVSDAPLQIAIIRPMLSSGYVLIRQHLYFREIMSSLRLILLFPSNLMSLTTGHVTTCKHTNVWLTFFSVLYSDLISGLLKVFLKTIYTNINWREKIHKCHPYFYKPLSVLENWSLYFSPLSGNIVIFKNSK